MGNQFEDASRLGITGKIFASAKKSGRGALVGYLPVGFPDVPGSHEAIKAIIEGTDGLGVDLVEIGMPYSDPMMDGVTIQAAATRALNRGVRTKDIFPAVELVSKLGRKAVVMTYWNIVEQYGVDAFCRDLANAGGGGCITPDLTPDEADEWFEGSNNYGLDRIFLVAPASSDERLALTVKACRGWVYCTSVMGVTGTRDKAPNQAEGLVARVRNADPNLPAGVGLGVSNGQQAKIVASYADAVIVGSAFIKPMVENDSVNRQDFTKVRQIANDLALGVRNTQG